MMAAHLTLSRNFIMVLGDISSTNRAQSWIPAALIASWHR